MVARKLKKGVEEKEVRDRERIGPRNSHPLDAALRTLLPPTRPNS